MIRPLLMVQKMLWPLEERIQDFQEFFWRMDGFLSLSDPY